MIGFLLPPSIPGALGHVAAFLLAEGPVNLNYTLSLEALASCIGQCQIKTVLTSRIFLEKTKLKLTVPAVFIEDAAAQTGLVDRILAVVAALLPAAMLERWLGRPSPAAL